MGQRRRIASLDGVRGIAILLVVACHVSPDTGPFRLGGSVGVTLFFVLSGYLITTILLTERATTGRVDARRFFLHRAARLVPALAVVLVLAPVLLWAVEDPTRHRYAAEAAAAAGYSANLVRMLGGDMGVLSHTWSLAVEEQFYLVWPVLLTALCLRMRGIALARAIAALALVALAWRFFGNAAFSVDRAYFGPDMNAGALLTGCALAAYEAAGRVRSGRTLAIAGLVGVVVLSAYPASITAGPTISAWWSLPATLAAAALIAGARAGGPGLLVASRLRWFGTISYGWYLWHLVLIDLWVKGHAPSVPQRGIAALIALAAAWASWRYVEQPVQSWVRRRRALAAPAMVPAPVAGI